MGFGWLMVATAAVTGASCSTPAGSSGEVDSGGWILPDVQSAGTDSGTSSDSAATTDAAASGGSDVALADLADGAADVAATDAAASDLPEPDVAGGTSDASVPSDWGSYFDDDDAEPDVSQFPDCAAGTILCKNKVKQVCDGQGGLASSEVCEGGCVAGVGCTVCQPGATQCDETSASVCNESGSAWVAGSCDNELGLSCDLGSGKCIGPCAAAAAERSYIGCEYWPVVTSNAGLYNGFSFAVAIASASDKVADVVVYKGTTKVAATTVQPGGVATVSLPWVAELKQSTDGATSKATYDASFTSKIVAAGAFHLKSTAPVTVSQFNPLQFEIPAKTDCDDTFNTGQCLSFTNDAAMLLPTTALGKDHVALSWPAGAYWNSTVKRLSSPGFVSIVATKDATQITLKTKGNMRGGNGVQAMAPGASQTFTLNAGDVLQVVTAVPPAPTSTLSCTTANGTNKLCPVPAGYDLSGTSIESTQPISVLGGHDCATIPQTVMACDHIEESIPPLNTWGKSVLVAAPQAVAGAATANGKPDSHVVRVISGADNNVIDIDPPIAAIGTPVLAKGEMLELPLANTSYHITGSGPILVGQFTLGSNQVDASNAGTINSKSDPSFGLAVPTSQFRKDYVFLVPATYTYSFVNVIAPTDAVLSLDGKAVTAKFTAIGTSGYGVARIAVTGGSHTMTGDVGFGLLVYGYAAYTSYMYPGGLNLAL